MKNKMPNSYDEKTVLGQMALLKQLFDEAISGFYKDINLSRNEEYQRFNGNVRLFLKPRSRSVYERISEIYAEDKETEILYIPPASEMSEIRIVGKDWGVIRLQIKKDYGDIKSYIIDFVPIKIPVGKMDKIISFLNRFHFLDLYKNYEEEFKKRFRQLDDEEQAEVIEAICSSEFVNESLQEWLSEKYSELTKRTTRGLI